MRDEVGPGGFAMARYGMKLFVFIFVGGEEGGGGGGKFFAVVSDKLVVRVEGGRSLYRSEVATCSATELRGYKKVGKNPNNDHESSTLLSTQRKRI